MPIIIKDNGTLESTTKPVRKDSPKFFHKDITGSGRASGMLCEGLFPRHIPLTENCQPFGFDFIQKNQGTVKWENGGTTTQAWPLSLLPADEASAWGNMWLPANETIRKVKIGHHDPSGDLFMYLEPMILVKQQVKNSYNRTESTTNRCGYKVVLTLEKEDAKKNHKTDGFMRLQSKYDIVNGLGSRIHPDILAAFEYTFNPRKTMKVLYDLLSGHIDNGKGLTLYPDAIDAYIDAYDLYGAVCDQSAVWQNEAADTFKKAVEAAIMDYRTRRPANRNQSRQQICMDTDIQERVLDLIERLCIYDIPLADYIDLYAFLENDFDEPFLVMAGRRSLNILLTRTLAELAKKKDQCQKIPDPAAPTADVIDPIYSAQQRNAIMSRSPLTMIQAGAGSGKSSVILARIRYLIASGVDPDDITVISFTNAAADHITEKAPHVHSMTFDKFINVIYSANVQKADISTPTILSNTLRMRYKRDRFVEEFCTRLLYEENNGKKGLNELNNFVQDHQAEVMDKLRSVNQTTLQLSNLICYQNIHKFNIPPEIRAKYLIVDEVQDNSRFQFIYTLKYTAKMRANLFIVGDCAQTLYEFRDADPRALNTLEASGVFDTYQLTTNYRSNQEVLDFANMTLANIEANQYARIQLLSNQKTIGDVKTFMDHVKVDYETISKGNNKATMICGYAMTKMRPWIDRRLAKGEQVAILSRYNAGGAMALENTLKNMYPDKKVVNICPPKNITETALSAFMMRNHDQLPYLPLKDLMNTISTMILTEAKPKKSASRFAALTEWLNRWIAQDQHKVNDWILQVEQGYLSRDAFLRIFEDSVLDYEIRNNHIKQHFLNEVRDDNRDSGTDADIVISTVHSAKGLEFDNVIYVCNEGLHGDDEKRVNYVAFTRAKKDLYVIGYNSTKTSRLVQAYDDIIKARQDKLITMED